MGGTSQQSGNRQRQTTEFVGSSRCQSCSEKNKCCLVIPGSPRCVSCDAMSTRCIFTRTIRVTKDLADFEQQELLEDANPPRGADPANTGRSSWIWVDNNEPDGTTASPTWHPWSEDSHLSRTPSHRGSSRPGPRELQCPFLFLPCTKTFSLTNTSEWIQHSWSHFTASGPPVTNQCPFCNWTCHLADTQRSWSERMQHVAAHHSAGDHLEDTLYGDDIYEWLWRNGSISYKERSRISHARLQFFLHKDISVAGHLMSRQVDKMWSSPSLLLPNDELEAIAPPQRSSTCCDAAFQPTSKDIMHEPTTRASTESVSSPPRYDEGTEAHTNFVVHNPETFRTRQKPIAIRRGPLTQSKRQEVAHKRKNNLVCSTCKRRKVRCTHQANSQSWTYGSQRLEGSDTIPMDTSSPPANQSETADAQDQSNDRDKSTDPGSAPMDIVPTPANETDHGAQDEEGGSRPPSVPIRSSTDSRVLSPSEMSAGRRLLNRLMKSNTDPVERGPLDPIPEYSSSV